VLSASFTIVKRPNSSPDEEEVKDNLALILGLAIGIGGAIILGITILVIWRWRKSNKLPQVN
jgi:hypothetical protein